MFFANKYKIVIIIFLLLLAIVGFRIYKFSYLASVNNSYADIAYKNYSLAYKKVRLFKNSFEQFKKQPSREGFNQLKQIWVHLLKYYNRAEIFWDYERFNNKNKILKLPNSIKLKNRISGYPINIEYIDYTIKDILGGIINNKNKKITKELLLKEQDKNNKNILGIHAIEFLLWGNRFDDNLPGNRSWNDYSNLNSSKQRIIYLDNVIDILLEDMKYLVGLWTPKSLFRNSIFTKAREKENNIIIIDSIISFLKHDYYENKIVNLIKLGKEYQENKFSNYVLLSLKENIDSIYYLYLGNFRKEGRGKLHFKSLITLSDRISEKITDKIINKFLNIRNSLLTIQKISLGKSKEKEEKVSKDILELINSNIESLELLLNKLK